MSLTRKVLLLLVILLSVISLSLRRNVRAQTTEEKLQQLADEITQYEQEISKLQSQANTLSNQIAQYDAQIRLTALKINETEERIGVLGGRIGQLEGSLKSLTQAFSSRVNETYKMARISEPFLMLLSTSDLNSAVSSYYYLQKIQDADRSLLLRLEKVQSDYEDEKVDQEELQSELENQKKVLGAQKSAKANLLEVTRNDEKRYQSLLATSRAEFEAIQAILAGKGEETEVGDVGEGEKIATVIQGASCNSSGGHVHFIVRQGVNTQNPFNYLRSETFENCSGSFCGSADADPFNPSGSWIWPINAPIKMSQGYGPTWAVRNTWVGKIYSFHNGLDIRNENNLDVKAVKAGKLYRGSYVGYKGCSLRYVRVDHADSDLDTLYLHINYL